jgi:hypothetical protein
LTLDCVALCQLLRVLSNQNGLDFDVSATNRTNIVRKPERDGEKRRRRLFVAGWPLKTRFRQRVPASDQRQAFNAYASVAG